jgi:four helix bundle protein
MPKHPTAPGDSEPWEDEKANSGYPAHEPSGYELREGESHTGESDAKPAFDLEERTAKFGEAVIEFAKKLPLSPVNNRIIDQLVGASTSVGANYCEADEAVSKREFVNKIGTCKKEAKEAKFFLRMAAKAVPGSKDQARQLWREAKELHLIFAKIFRSGRNG